jgi:4-alpha-glucanotransferase
MNKRGSGVLLHITSLPSQYGIGDLGPKAFEFLDFLHHTKQSFWQILPLNPTTPVFGNSPYSSPSAFAGNPLFISPELLIEEDLLSRSGISQREFPSDRVDYGAVANYKRLIFSTAYENFKNRGDNSEFQRFCSENSYWLEDYALFIVLKERFKDVWSNWPDEIKNRNPKKLEEIRKESKDRVEFEKFLQYLFFKQWFSFKERCNSKGVRIIGDVPIYVSFDSVDVWANPNIFKLDENKRPTFVAGVPPDYFSETGQLWGNPVYRWDVLRESGFSWWIKRMEHNFKMFDIVRLDHFRGFVAYWEVPAGEKTAINGKWVEVPAEDFFNTLRGHFPNLPIIAEDLGYITSDVREVMDRFGFPGMKLLIFAFGDDFPRSIYLPHNYERNCVVYTGTHDNNTVRGWWKNESDVEQRKRFCRYIGKRVKESEVHWEFIRLAMMSVANFSIIPMQDILGLGEEARMNLPATSKGNWEWRLREEQITSSVEEKLRELTETYQRD